MKSHRRAEAGANGKKIYRKPETLSRETLEALAVVCDTGKTDPLSCSVGPIQS
jgi:hypothetical protein